MLSITICRHGGPRSLETSFETSEVIHPSAEKRVVVQNQEPNHVNSKWDGTTADDSVHPLQYNEGSFKTEVCRYTLKVMPDTEKSLYNKEYLQVQLEGSKQDRSVTLELHFNNDAKKTVSLYRDEAYKDMMLYK